jgi:hypothetical protein
MSALLELGGGPMLLLLTALQQLPTQNFVPIDRPGSFADAADSDRGSRRAERPAHARRAEPRVVTRARDEADRLASRLDHS